jgi:uncharacterized membrane protein (DUF106 family)
MIEKLALKLIHWIGSVNSVITHTILFILAFLSYFLGFDLTKILLVITTIVSLEAIYLSIFIQMSVNSQAQKLHTLQKDVQEIQEDVEDIQENVEDIQEDIQEDSDKK